MADATAPDLGRAALVYAERFGSNVIPLHTPTPTGCSCGKSSCKSIGKHPRSTNGITDATRDPVTIAEWWGRWPSANIGLAADGLIVLDRDPRHGGDDSLGKLEREHGELPRTVRQLTGGGGDQHFYLAPEGVVIRNAVAIRPGLDIRAAGGYVVAPPSLHASGRRYTWDVMAHIAEVPFAPAPEWLVEMCAERPQERRATSPEEWVRLLSDGVTEGARNATAARLAGYLLRRRVDPYVVLEVLTLWNTARVRPPLDEDELVAVVDSIAAREEQRRAS